MSLESDLDKLFSDEDEAIIHEPLRFKAKLGIGERAFALIRARDHLTTFTEALGFGATASAAAGSSVVAGTFFANTGFVASAMSSIGLGAAAATPIGWVLAAGVVSGAAYVGVSRFFERSRDSDLVIVPKYINTPMDIIALAMIEQMLPVSLKLAHADGEFAEEERKAINRYYVDEWGYSKAFVSHMISEYAADTDSISFSRLAQTLAEYCEQNPDCDRGVIMSGFLQHLGEVIEADGRIDEQELLQLEYLKTLLQTMETNSRVSDVVLAAKRSAAATVESAGTVLSKGVEGSQVVAVGAKGAVSKALTMGLTYASRATTTIKSGAGGVVGKWRSNTSKPENK